MTSKKEKTATQNLNSGEVLIYKKLQKDNCNMQCTSNV